MSDTDPVMQPPRRILLATDLSAHSDRALDRAIRLAHRWQAALHVVHALRPDVPTTWLPYTSADLAPGDAGTEAIKRQIRRDLSDRVADPTIHVAAGEPERVILKTAEREDCSLIIMGANGPSYADVTVGTTSARILRQSRRSVLIVRARPHNNYQRILIGTDYTDESRHGLQTAATWFTQADLTVMHVLDTPYQSLLPDADSHEALTRPEQDAMTAFMAAAQLPVDRHERIDSRIEYGYPEIQLRHHGIANDIDLTVIGSVKRGMAFHVLVGTNAARIVQHVPSDILIVYEDEA